MDSTRSHKRHRVIRFLLPYGIIGLLVLLSFWPTLSGDFILDDGPLIRNNSFIQKPQSVASYLSQEDGVDKSADPEASHTGYYRPLINLTYRMDYLLWGLSAPGFRTTNLILHLLNCFILFSLASLLVDDRKIAILIAALFSVHPVNTEAVSWISSRNNILVSFFCLSSLYCYFQARRRRNFGLTLLSAAFFAAGLLSKEFAVMLLPIFFLYHRLFPGNERSARAELLVYSPFLLALAGYLALRMVVIGSLSLPSDGIALWTRVYFSPYLIMMNLRYVLFPSGLHSFILGYPGSFLEWRAVAGFVGLFLYGSFLWKKRAEPTIVFFGMSFLIALFPVLNVVKTSAVTLLSMRWLYFPTGFLLISLVCALRRLIIEKSRTALIIGGCIVLYLGSYSFVLNKELWHSEDLFFRQEVTHFKNYYYLGGLAENLSQKGEHRDAETYFRQALEHSPDEVRNYINYSALLLNTGRPADAILYLNRAAGRTMTRSERAEMQNNLGMALFRLQRYDGAIESLNKAIDLTPREALFWANLGAAHGATGDFEESVRVLERGMSIASDPLRLKKNLAISYIGLKEFEKALAILQGIPVEGKEDHEVISNLLSQARVGASLKKGGKAARGEKNIQEDSRGEEE